MPFIPFQSLLPDIVLGAWHITETELFFMDKVKLFAREWQQLAGIKHPQKRLEWLSSRLCMKELLQISDSSFTESLREENGTPYLSNNPHSISYTHSNPYAAAIASPCIRVGIDMEYLGKKRNEKTRFLWMNDQELAYYDSHQHDLFFTLAWSTKETVYKLYGSGVGFREQIAIEVDGLQIQQNGILSVLVQKEDLTHKHHVAYAITPDFLLTYAGTGHSLRQHEPVSQ